MSLTHKDPLSLADADFLARAQTMCRSKAAYVTRAEAVTFVRRNNYNGSPYRCPWCDHWHVTSYDRARAKAFRRRLSRLLRTEP